MWTARARVWWRRGVRDAREERGMGERERIERARRPFLVVFFHLRLLPSLHQGAAADAPPPPLTPSPTELPTVTTAMAGPRRASAGGGAAAGKAAGGGGGSGGSGAPSFLPLVPLLRPPRPNRRHPFFFLPGASRASPSIPSGVATEAEGGGRGAGRPVARGGRPSVARAVVVPGGGAGGGGGVAVAAAAAPPRPPPARRRHANRPARPFGAAQAGKVQHAQGGVWAH